MACVNADAEPMDTDQVELRDMTDREADHYLNWPLLERLCTLDGYPF
jgi:hypothetical protein